MTETPAMWNGKVPVARSPLAPAGESMVVDGWEFFSGAGDGPVAVADRSSLSKVQFRARSNDALADALGARFGRAAWKSDRLVVGSGPNEWMIFGAPGAGDQTKSWLAGVLSDTGSDGHAIDLTHGRALMRVSGPATADLLHRVTAVNLDDRLVPDGSAFRTSVAHVVTDMVRDDIGTEPSYLLHCERSSGYYLQQSLLAAGAASGVVAGASTPDWPDHTGGVLVSQRGPVSR